MALFKIKSSSSRSRRNKNKDKEQQQQQQQKQQKDKSSSSSQQQQQQQQQKNKKKNNNNVVVESESPSPSSSSSASSSKTMMTSSATTVDSSAASFYSSSSSSSSSSNSLTTTTTTTPTVTVQSSSSSPPPPPPSSSSSSRSKVEEAEEKKASDDDDIVIDEDDHPDDEIDDTALKVFQAKKVNKKQKQSYRELAAELEQDEIDSNDDDDDDDLDIDIIDKHMDEISDMIFEVEKEEILNGNGNVSRSSSSEKENATSAESNKPQPQPPLLYYTLEDHCRNLNLKRTSDNNQEMWYIDCTPEYVYGTINKKDSDDVSSSTNTSSVGGRRSSSSSSFSSPANNVVILRNIIQDYIQPISTTDTKFQYERIGLTSVLATSNCSNSDEGNDDDDDDYDHSSNITSSNTKKSSSSKTTSDDSDDNEEPLPVRTVTIRIRPDASQELILRSVKKVFEEYNNNSSKQSIMVLEDTFDCYKAIGCNGCGVLICVLANIVTHKITLERKLWLRFYHIYQLTDKLLSKNQLQQLVDLKKSNHGPQIIPKRTSKQIDFIEASSVVQFMKQHNLTGTDPSPTETKHDTSIWFQATFEPSPSAMSIFYNNKVYPALAKQDYALWYTTFDIVDQIWYQLSKVHFLTYDSLILDPTRRFGSIQWQNMKSNYIIDSNYGYQLSKISRQHTQFELHTHLIKATSIYQNTIDEYNELIDFLITVHQKQYNIPLSQELCEMLDSVAANKQMKLSKTKFVLSKRNRNDYPWHKDCQQVLQQIQDDIKTKTTTKGLVVTTTTTTQQQHLSKVNKYVRQFLLSLHNVDDQEQQLVLKEINRRGMVEVSKIQNVAKQLLATLIMFPMKYPHLPHIIGPSNDWYEFSMHSRTSNTRRHPMPLLVFKTKLGQGCITPHQLMFVTGYLSTKVDVYDWTDIELQYTPNNMLTKISVIDSNTNQKICGFYPRDTILDCEKLIRICRTIKALQEA